MKKRVLSFLLACFMVVSTFIISRPIVDVHAVEAEALETWALPYNWHTNLDKDENGWELASKNNGLWRLTSFEDPSTDSMRWASSSATLASGTNNTESPQSYIESYNNRVNIGVSGVPSTWSSWYVNYGTRYQGKAFDTGNNVDYMEVIPGNNASSTSHNHPAVVFTAPSDGLYSYTELVEQTVFTYGDAAVTMTATVRKNGEILNSFTPTETNASKTLDGSVYLQEGDLLAFVFSEDTSNASLTDKSTYVKISNVVVQKITNTTTNYSMPLAWVDGCEQGTGSYVVAKKGDWRLTSFSNPSNTNTIVWNGSNQPWMNNSQNASTTSFYVNGTAKWTNGTIFNKGVEGEYILAIPYGKYGRTSGNVDTDISGANPTALFTAPVSGEYAYSEILRGVTMTDVNGTAVTVTATVRKNGEVIDTVTISAENPYACNTGTVTLEAGDYLMFVFVLDQTDARIKDHTDFIRLYAADVALIEAAPTYENSVDLSIVFDETFADTHTDKFGMIKPMGYSTVKGLYDDTLNYELLDDGRWIVWDSEIRRPVSGNWTAVWTGTVGGTVTGIGGHYTGVSVQRTTGSALEFTAPYDGTFKISASMTSGYFTSNKSYSNYYIKAEDGSVLASSTNVGATDRTIPTSVSKTVTLTKGEKVYIIREPIDNSSVSTINQSCEGSITLTITDLEHVCSSETVKHIAAVTPGCEDGNIEYWACTCATNYADADATTEITGSVVVSGTGHKAPAEYAQDATQHWQYCANGCGEFVVAKTNHTWENGVCSVCTYQCDHANANVATCVSASVCPVCSVELAPINSNNHVMTDAVHSNGNGTHRYVRICCDASSIVTENCVYGTDNVCDLCGYDNTDIETVTNNVNNAYDNLFNEGNNNVSSVQGPASGALNDYITKTEGTVIADIEYHLFNINHENDTVTLRHNFLITTEEAYTITLNGKTVTLTQYEGSDLWYFDVPQTLGKYGVADEITVTCGENTVTYTVSLYSYIKKALASNEVSENEKTYLKALYDANEEANKVDPVLVAIANQAKQQIQVYDITDGDIDEPVWTYDNTVGTSSGFKIRKYNGRDVLLITTGTEAEMVDIDTKERIWYTNNTPGNSHSIELLPNGVIAVAGTTGHDIHFYNINYSDPTYVHDEEDLQSAHGVLWDPTEGVLWAAGRTHLWAYSITVDANGKVTATKDEVRSIELPDDHAHDLQPYYGNTDCLLISTHHYIYIYNKKTQSFAVLVTRDDVKGVTVLENGDIVYLYPNPDWSTAYDSWNTSWINKLDVATGETTEYHNTEGGRFYKLRVWNTDYQ